MTGNENDFSYVFTRDDTGSTQMQCIQMQFRCSEGSRRAWTATSRISGMDAEKWSGMAHGENHSETMILRRTDSDEKAEEDGEERGIETEVENGMVTADPKKGLHRPDYDLWRPDPKENSAWTARYKDNPQGVTRRTREFSAEMLNSSEHQRYLAMQQVHEEQRDFELEQIDVWKKRIAEEQEKLDQE